MDLFPQEETAGMWDLFSVESTKHMIRECPGEEKAKQLTFEVIGCIAHQAPCQLCELGQLLHV